MKDKKLIPVLVIITVIALFIRILPLLILAGVIFYLVKKRKPTPQIEEKPRPVIEEPTIDPSVIQGTINECQNLIDEKIQIIRDTDLRQFKGRNDVTKEELATYMFEQQYWNGAYERRIQMEEITKHCNLTMQDVAWVEEELKHHTINGQTYVAMSVKSDEHHAIWQEMNRINREETYKTLMVMEQEYRDRLQFDEDIGITNFPCYKEFKEHLDTQHKEIIESVESSLRSCDYDAWIKLKGYEK